MIPVLRSRVLTLIVATYVVDAAVYVWRLWGNGVIGGLLVTGAPGFLLVNYWAIALSVGPIACIRLWRRNRTGLTAAIVVVGCGLTLDMSLYLLADAGQWSAPLSSVLARIGVILFLVYALRDLSADV